MITLYEIRFTCALIITLLAGLSNKRNSFLLIMISISTLLVGFDVKHTLLVMFNVMLIIGIAKVGIREPMIGFMSNIVFLYAYKHFGNLFISNIHGVYDISGILMINSIKTCYIIKEEVISSREIIKYLLHPAGLLTGPVVPYSELKPMPSVRINYKDVKVAAIALIFYLVSKKYDFIEMIKLPDSSFLYKLLLLQLFNFCARSKFYFAWSISNCIFHAFGYRNRLNFDIYKTELPFCVRDIIQNWNKFVNAFLKEFVFKKFITFGKPFSLLMCFVTSALLHDIKLTFVLFTLSFLILGNISDLISKELPFDVLKTIQSTLFCSVFSIPFFIHSVSHTMEIWKQMHYFMHFYLLIGSLIVFIKRFMKKEESKAYQLCLTNK